MRDRVVSQVQLLQRRSRRCQRLQCCQGFYLIAAQEQLFEARKTLIVQSLQRCDAIEREVQCHEAREVQCG